MANQNSEGHPTGIGNRFVGMSVRLIRALQALDPDPQLSAPQASALAVIVHAQGITPSDLAEFERVKRPTIARTLGELEEGGLIERRPDEHDRRSHGLWPTPAGLQVFEKGQARRCEPLARLLGELGPEDVARVVDALPILDHLTDALVMQAHEEWSERGAG